MARGIQHIYATLDAAHTVGLVADSTLEYPFHLLGAQTSISGGYCSLPAGTIRKHDMFVCSALVEVIAANSTDTLDLFAYLGPITDVTTGILCANYAILDATAAACIGLEFTVICEAEGAGGTARFSVVGKSYNSASTAISATLSTSGVDAQVSTLVANALALTAKWSASNAGNDVRLRSFHCVKTPALPSV